MFTNSQNSSVKRPVGSLGGGYEREDRNCLEVIQLLEDNPGTGGYSRFQVTGVIKKFGKYLFLCEERNLGGGGGGHSKQSDDLWRYSHTLAT